MAEFAPKNVISAVLVLVIIVFIIGVIYTLISPQVKTLLGFNILGTTADAKLGLSQFNAFVKEYKICKSIPDSDCICPFTQFTLPQNGFIEIKNSAGLTSFNYYEGSVKSATEVKYINLLEGCEPKQNVKPGTEQKGCVKDSEYVIENDAINIPYKAPGNINSYTKEGKLDISNYIADSKIYLAYFESSRASFETSKSLGGETFATPIEVFTTADIRGYNQFNLQGIYKSSNGLYFIPTSNALFKITASDEKNLNEIKSIKQCKKPEGFDNAVKIFNELKDSAKKCSEQKVIGPTNCNSVSTRLPEKYRIIIAPAAITLSYEEKPILDSSGLIFALFEKTAEKENVAPLKPNLVIDSKSAIIQLDILSCSDNVVCIKPRTETETYQTSSREQKIAHEIIQQ